MTGQRPTGFSLEIRSSPDPARGSMPLAQAAKLIGVSRQWAEILLKRGTLAGFGVRGTERNRLYAYTDDALRLRRQRESTRDDKARRVDHPEDSALERQLLETANERDRYRAEAISLRETTLRLLTTNDLLTQAHEARASSLEHLKSAFEDETSAADLLQRAIQEQAEALRQFVIPGTAAELVDGDRGPPTAEM